MGYVPIGVFDLGSIGGHIFQLYGCLFGGTFCGPEAPARSIGAREGVNSRPFF